MLSKNKLIVLRGNSGSGKSTIAKLLQSHFPDKKIALVEQDYFRRTILRERGNTNGLHTKMLKTLAKYSKNSFFFYFDVSLEETLRRSKFKDNFQDFGPEKVKSWYKARDFLNLKNEFVIPESFSEKETLNFILETTKL